MRINPTKQNQSSLKSVKQSLSFEFRLLETIRGRDELCFSYRLQKTDGKEKKPGHAEIQTELCVSLCLLVVVLFLRILVLCVSVVV